MKLSIALRLGRVSNLPTVWTNTLAALVLAGSPAAGWTTLLLILAVSLAYIGGMYLNDAFDAEIDARERPERPIPSGLAERRTVFVAGYAMLAACIILLGAIGIKGGTGLAPAFGGVVLAGAIVLYDINHKGNRFGPLLMGLCRALVYVAAGLAVTPVLPPPLWAAALAMLCYVAGLTYTAKQESLGRVESMWPLAVLGLPWAYGLWLSIATPITIVFLALLTILMGVTLRLLFRRGPGEVPRAVVTLIAGIALLDAVFLAAAGAVATAIVAVVLFALTLVAQRYVPGT
ncbi:4-hydroxybenzoate polyprenyltransferase [Tepidamorphus gemmatus]|uniref:4-hydroxybenzoate polyprenyltransferase n=1 Tax=Tepidamorphus gemmatus TaxID=747076 RepID=A0A4R3MHC6_9HYPH|nr:UbiA family prenyltransferase [Tepidamorphus gemmatus]TCT12588.1 4-hydroxybenzoate polyprenyltransferase [Tepidamorphus gemmatus]